MEKENEKKRQRPSVASVKKASKHGEITQKMMAFKVDLDLAEKMQGERNKGRLINNLLRKHYMQSEGDTAPSNSN